MGVVEAGGRQLVALEDVARHYRRPSICDIKVGFRTWYPNGDAAYIQRCQLKDAATTQSTLGFKICGMQARLTPLVLAPCAADDHRAPPRASQIDHSWCRVSGLGALHGGSCACCVPLPHDTAPTVLLTFSSRWLHVQVYRQCQRGYWRASKRWCKALPPEGVNKALLRFANNEAGLRPVDIYGGARGAIAQLHELEAWFQARSRPLSVGEILFCCRRLVQPGFWHILKHYYLLPNVC